jgi:hypothetical protein
MPASPFIGNIAGTDQATFIINGIPGSWNGVLTQGSLAPIAVETTTSIGESETTVPEGQYIVEAIVDITTPYTEGTTLVLSLDAGEGGNLELGIVPALVASTACRHVVKIGMTNSLTGETPYFRVSPTAAPSDGQCSIVFQRLPGLLN